MCKEYILVMDSGMGGLTTFIDMVSALPNENLIFVGDTEHFPYGEKTKQQVSEYVINIIESLHDYKIKAMVIACNTATSACAPTLREKYPFPVIGMEPAIKPAVEYVKQLEEQKRVLLLSTSLTKQGEKLITLMHKIDDEGIIDCLAVSRLVRFAEDLEFDTHDLTNYVKRHIMNSKVDQYGAIVLGCTHFIWFRDFLTQMAKGTSLKVFDGNEGSIRNLTNILASQDRLNKDNSKRELLVRFTNPNDSQKIEELKKHIQEDITIF